MPTLLPHRETRRSRRPGTPARAGGSTATRWSTGLLTAVLPATLARSAGSGGYLRHHPDRLGRGYPWTRAEIVQFIKDLPHDASPLGLRAAHLRTRPTPPTFRPVRFAAADGTPLAGILGLGLNADTTPRPGVVLVTASPRARNTSSSSSWPRYSRNGWSVLAVDLRDHGETRRASKAPFTNGWKEADDILAAVRALRTESKATSVSVVGFSFGDGASSRRWLGNGRDRGRHRRVRAALADHAGDAAPPGYTPSPFVRFFLDFLGTKSFYEYDERAARFYGVDLRTFEAHTVWNDVAKVKAPLLLLDSTGRHAPAGRVRQGAHDGGPQPRVPRPGRGQSERAHVPGRSGQPWRHALPLGSLLVRACRPELPQVLAGSRRTARSTTAVPPLDILAEGTLAGPVATYRLLVRNHGSTAVRPMDLSVDLPVGARLDQCWVGTVGIGRCAVSGTHVTWTLPTLAGGNTAAGPFGAVVDVSAYQPGDSRSPLRSITPRSRW